MTLYYSIEKKGFYDSEIHTTIPSDGIEISREKHQQLLRGLSEGRVVVFDGEELSLQDAPLPPLAEYKKRVISEINARRQVEERKGHTYLFPDDISDVIQLRDERDLINVNAQVTSAQLLAANGIVDPIMPFQALNNQTHMMTPQQIIQMGVSVATFITGLYQTAWQIKQQIEACTTHEEVTEVGKWPEPV